MKTFKTLLFISFLAITSISFAQEESIELLDEANQYYELKDYNKALEIYNNIVFNYKKSEVFPLALYNKAKTLEMLGEYDYAVFIYEKFLNGTYNDETFIDASLMSNPYANFSYKSATGIAGIAYDKGNFQKAYDYYNLADTVYIYKSFCGNDGMERYYELVQLRAKCLEKLERDEDAIKLCVKFIFPGMLGSTDEIVDELIRIIDRSQNREDIKLALNNSLKDIYKKTFGRNNDYEAYCFKLFGEEVVVTDYLEPWKEIDTEEKAKEKILATTFFQNYMKEK
ncbi:MAG: tetratricopeptide repeat protein [Ignavibacteriae bacterium]|nr:tetratricopeptide repeat protein [Ignavibacteriota bacterium]